MSETEINGKEIAVLLNDLKKKVSLIQTKVKSLEQKFKKDVRVASKVNKKAPRKPSGFARPSKVTDKLTDFMNKEAGTLVARTEVTQYLIKYIKENSLQNAENKRIIKPDEKLMDLLESGENEITYFNLQKYMNKHFIKG